MKGTEYQTESGMEIPSASRTFRLFGRALTLRCPHCGRGPVLHHLLKLRVRCGNCGLRLQRGEHDSFTGSMFVLFTMVGLANYLVLTVTAIATETTPWDLLQYGLPVFTLVMLVICFPFSKLSWLAFDLMLRPVTPQELVWHQEADVEYEIDRDYGGKA